MNVLLLAGGVLFSALAQVILKVSARFPAWSIRWLAITASMLDAVTSDSWAGVYVTRTGK